MRESPIEAIDLAPRSDIGKVHKNGYIVMD